MAHPPHAKQNSVGWSGREGADIAMNGSDTPGRQRAGVAKVAKLQVAETGKAGVETIEQGAGP